MGLALPALYFVKSPAKQDLSFWMLLLVAFTGTLSWTWVQSAGGEHSSFSFILWVTISACIITYMGLSILTKHAWRLGTLLLPYLCAMAGWAVLWTGFSGEVHHNDANLTIWIGFHILTSIFTYALATLAATAASSAFIVERALKTKRPSNLSRMLPSILDSEKLMVKLLISCQGLLAFDILSGIALSVAQGGAILSTDHKSLFSYAAFIAIALLLLSHFKTGVRGKKATRLMLVAYLLLSFGFLGVKFVTDILLGS